MEDIRYHLQKSAQLDGQIKSLQKKSAFLQGEETKPVWHPPFESHRVGNSLYIDVELPGVPPEMVDIRFDGNFLQIAGEKPRPTIFDNCDFGSSRQFGRFSCQFVLPQNTAREALTKKMENGVLHLKIELPGENQLATIDSS